MSRIRSWQLPTIRPPLQAVMGRLGYNPKKATPDAATLALVTEVTESTLPLLSPRGLTMELKISGNDGRTVTLENGLSLPSGKLSVILQNCRSVTVMAVTIGPQLTETASRLMVQGEMTRAVIMDAAGSEAVEAFTDYIEAVLAREKSLLRLKPVMRYSPGYGDLPLACNRDILNYLEAIALINMSADPETCLLKPEKSITALLGWEKS